jgi:hypothetical protein
LQLATAAALTKAAGLQFGASAELSQVTADAGRHDLVVTDPVVTDPVVTDPVVTDPVIASQPAITNTAGAATPL